MARKSKVEAEKTRKRILASALSLFAKKGYDHTTFVDIAARLKMTKGAVYWYFDSKEALLVELVRMALERFSRQLHSLIPDSELTFLKVAEMMIRNAEMVVNDPRARDFFALMHGQIRWSDKSMESVRAQLLSDAKDSPKAVFQQAVENDLAAGRITRKVNPVSVASSSIALWDGLVKARIDDFLDCDLSVTLRNFYNGMWQTFRN